MTDEKPGSCQRRRGIGEKGYLKSENADLKTKILELNQKMARMVPNGVPTKKEQELIGLLEQVNHQLETAERSRRQLGGDVERLTAQRTRLEHDVDTLKSKLATVQQDKTEPFTKVKQLGLSEKQSFVMVESDLKLPSDSLSIIEVQHAQEVAKLKSDLDEQQALVASLIQQLKDKDTKMVSVANSSEAKTPPSYSSEDQTLRQNFKELEKKYYRLQSDYETVQQELASLRDDQQSKDRHNAAYNQVQARGFTEKIDSMTAQVVAKEETLKQKTKEIAQLTEKLKDLAVENEAISILKAQRLLVGWDAKAAGQGRYLREQETETAKMCYLSVIERMEVLSDGWKAKAASQGRYLRGRETEAAGKMHYLSVIKGIEIEKIHSIFPRMQVEVYQSDFNAEREARERLVGEKDQLAEDLRHLQRRNQQLIDDLSKYQQTPNRQPPTSTTA
ncbi:unnamed protein product, partial [Timema podura]|nr:unnamed protein product [Timema podura]